MTNNNKVLIIGITGKALSGKDTFASLICELLQDKAHVHLFAFADKLKQEACTALGIPITYAYEQPYKESIRPLLQVWGDMRKCVAIGGRQTYWCEPIDKLVGDCLVKTRATGVPCAILVTDVRYDFEAQYLKDFIDVDVFMVKMENPQESDTTTHNQHSSETELAKVFCEYVIINDKEKGKTWLKEKTQRVLDLIDTKIRSREATLTELSQE